MLTPHVCVVWAWTTACDTAGLTGRLAHDMRRSAVRNMERLSVPRKVAMQMVGHKTESIYRRYHIVAESDIRAAGNRLEQLHAAPAATKPAKVVSIRRRRK